MSRSVLLLLAAVLAAGALLLHRGAATCPGGTCCERDCPCAERGNGACGNGGCGCNLPALLSLSRTAPVW